MGTVVHLAALSAVGAGYPAGSPVLVEEVPPAPPVAPPVPPLLVPPVPVVPPPLVVPPVRAVIPPTPPFPPAPLVDVVPPAAEIPPVPGIPPVLDGEHVDMQRAQMSVGTIRSVAQHAHAQTVFVHWPSTGMGTFSSVEQVHLSPPNPASHWAMAVYCVLHFVMALTVASAAFTQLVWQSVTGQALVAWEAHIAAQACARVGAVPESRAVPPSAPPPPEPAGVPPVAFAVKPPEPAPPVADGPPPLAGTPPRAVVPPLGLASWASEPFVPVEQANTKSIATGRVRKLELCIGKPLHMKGRLGGKSGRAK
jgi:hypothetical protein